MNGYDFCCWLEGVLDMNESGLSAEQVAKIYEKLKTVKSPATLQKEAEKSGETKDKAALPRC